MTPLIVAASIAVRRPEMILRASAAFAQLGERRPLGRREALDHLGGEDRRVTLLRLTQDEPDLVVQNEDTSGVRLASMTGLFMGSWGITAMSAPPSGVAPKPGP